MCGNCVYVGMRGSDMYLFSDPQDSREKRKKMLSILLY